MFCYTLFWLWWQWWCWYDGSDNIRPQFKGAGFVAPAKMMHLPVYTCHEDSPPKSFLPELISILMVCGNETFDQWHIFFWSLGMWHVILVTVHDNGGLRKCSDWFICFQWNWRTTKDEDLASLLLCSLQSGVERVQAASQFHFFTGSLTQRCWCMKIRPRDVDSCIDCLDTSTNWSHKYFLNTVSESAIST
jgi:hypothetical protein